MAADTATQVGIWNGGPVFASPTLTARLKQIVNNGFSRMLLQRTRDHRVAS